MAVDAIERNIAVIGEAANHLPQSATAALPQIDWPAIRGMRNILVHEYFGVETTVIRDVIATKLQAPRRSTSVPELVRVLLYSVN